MTGLGPEWGRVRERSPGCEAGWFAGLQGAGAGQGQKAGWLSWNTGPESGQRQTGGRHRARWMTGDRNERVRVSGKPKQGWVRDAGRVGFKWSGRKTFESLVKPLNGVIYFNSILNPHRIFQ